MKFRYRNTMSKRCFVALIFLMYAFLSGAFGQGRGDRYARLEVGDDVYLNVRVTEVTPQSLKIAHSRGFAQIYLEELDERLQEKYGYDPERAKRYAEAQERKRLQRIREKQLREAQKDRLRLSAAEKQADERAQQLVSRSMWPVTPPRLYRGVDLRPQFFEWGFGQKDQFRGDTCAIFSTVTALEFEAAKHFGKPVALSEEFVVWAIRRFDDPAAGFGQGFNLFQVALQASTHGVPRDELYAAAIINDEVVQPTEKVVKDARSRAGFQIVVIDPSHGREAFFNQVIHALNAKSPVVVGGGWPHPRTLRNTALVSEQAAVTRHAITLVGYLNPDGTADSFRFIFKNSWGSRWGSGGYGFMTQSFFMEHIKEGMTIRWPENSP